MIIFYNIILLCLLLNSSFDSIFFYSVGSSSTTVDDEGFGKSISAATSQAASTSMSTVNPTTTLSLNMLNTFMGSHNENSSSSGCGGTVSSLSMVALMSTGAAGGGGNTSGLEMDVDASMKSSFERLEVNGSHFSRANNLDQEYSAMVASVYEKEKELKWVRLSLVSQLNGCLFNESHIGYIYLFKKKIFLKRYFKHATSQFDRFLPCNIFSVASHGLFLKYFQCFLW